MNKYLIYISLGLLLVVFIITRCYFNERDKRVLLQNNVEQVTLENEKLIKYNQEKESKIQELDKKYYKILNSYEGTNCENQKVSEELLNILRNLDKND